MKNLICSALATLLAASAAQAQQAVQWRVQDGGNGHWYGRLTGSFPFNHAVLNAGARSVGAHLVSYSSSGEEQFVIAALGVGLVGLQSEAGESGFRWASGEALGYSNWGSASCFAGPYPNNSSNQARFVFQSHPECLGSQGLNNAWDDYPPSELGSAITDPNIEWSADCNNDGIVDYGQCRDGSLPDYNGNNIPDCCEAGTPCAVGNYPVQWRAADGGTGHWYQLCPVGASPAWSACLSAAGRMGGTLACIGSAQEDAFVRSTQPGSPLWRDFGPWLGGFQNTGSVEPAGGWAWINGEPWTWAGWDAEPLGEPNNAGCGDGEENRLHYVACQGASPHWNDAPNSGLSSCCLSPMAVSSYVVEWSADCNADGIVDKGQILRGQLPDTNNNGIPDGCEVPSCIDADIYRDFNVNGADLGILLSQWGPNTPLTESDLNRDGAVDGLDLGLLLSFWGPCP